MTTDVQVKENDVFHCRFTQSYCNKRVGWDLRHCFEGTLVAKDVNGEIVLFDTFWGIGRTSENKWFTLDQIGVDIEIEYYCNLDEIEKMEDADKYYDEKDVFHLSEQHGCSERYRYTFIRKGAQRSAAKMIEVAKYLIEGKESEIRSAEWRIEDLRKTIDKINSGDLSVYI
jgi:hypothetical protein